MQLTGWWWREGCVWGEKGRLRESDAYLGRCLARPSQFPCAQLGLLSLRAVHGGWAEHAYWQAGTGCSLVAGCLDWVLPHYRWGGVGSLLTCTQPRHAGGMSQWFLPNAAPTLPGPPSNFAPFFIATVIYFSPPRPYLFVQCGILTWMINKRSTEPGGVWTSSEIKLDQREH